MDDTVRSHPGAPGTHPSPVAGSASLLLIQDEREAGALREQLGSNAMAGAVTVTHAPSLDTAMAELDSGHHEVVILDLDQPEVGGIAGLADVCRRTTTPVIALSSTDDEQLGLAAMHAGAHDYLVKGHLTATAIRRVVRYAIERGRWRNEQQRRERLQQHQLQLILSQFPGTLWTTDSELRFTQTVGGGLDRLGVEEDEVLGRELGEYLEDPDGMAVQAHRRSLEGEMAEYEWQQSGRQWHAVTAPLADDAGRVIGVVGVATDVTEQLTIATELLELNRMKDTFLQGVSHELRTPLTSIVGFAQVLSGYGHHLGTEQLQIFYKRLLVNAHRLEALLDDLLDVDRLTQGRLEPIRTPTDLAGLITTIAEHQDAPDHPVTLELETVTLAVEASRIERIVDNLLRNAARHTPPGTQVWVRLLRDGDGAKIVVDDAGPGIPPEDRARLLFPFEQGDHVALSPQPGTGLGLALVNTFARMHGGEVEITDSPAGGARIIVSLPPAPATTAPAPMDTLSASGSSNA